MIKLFRRIREQTIKENRFSKYTLYAIGEIILVVIGILIALQINNKNLEKKTRTLENDYLNSLNIEIQTNNQKLNESINVSKSIDKSLIQAVRLFDPKVLDTINIDTFKHCLFNVAGNSVSYEPANGVISDIINSGKLSIISNKKLRHQLASYNSDIKEIEKHLNWQTNIIKEIQGQFKEYGSLRTLLIDSPHSSIVINFDNGVDNKSLFKSNLFENNLLDYLLTNRVLLNNYYAKMKDTLNMLLTEIEKELKNGS